MAIYTCSERRPEAYDCKSREVTYEGCVLDTYERNGYEDSDFYAIVWDDAEGELKSVQYATTRGWTYHNNAVVDADEPLREVVRAYLVERYVEKLTNAWNSDVTKGRRVESLTTKGKAKGITGVVEVVEPSKYDRYGLAKTARVRVETPESPYCGRTVYVDTTKLRLLGEADPVEIRERAERLADRGPRSFMLAPVFGL